jgi:hypothetical protein
MDRDHASGEQLPPGIQDAPGAVQDRRACCGTMNLAEYHNVERLIEAEQQALARWCAENGRAAVEPVAASPQQDQQQ